MIPFAKYYIMNLEQYGISEPGQFEERYCLSLTHNQLYGDQVGIGAKGEHFKILKWYNSFKIHLTIFFAVDGKYFFYGIIHF